MITGRAVSVLLLHHHRRAAVRRAGNCDYAGALAEEAIATARESVRDIRVAEVTKQDIVVGDDEALLYRTKIQLSFKYESE